MLGLIFNKDLKVTFVVYNLLEVFLDRGNENLVLLKSLLHLVVLLLEGTDSLLYLTKLVICLRQQILQFCVLFVSLTLKTLELF